MRVALYARVSTRDKDQNPENQLILLRREAERAGDTIAKEYIDEESGGTEKRPAFQAMLRDAEKRRFDLVRVFALDRFSRQGIEAVFSHLSHLQQCGVQFWSYSEPLMNSMGTMTPLFTAVFAWAAAYNNQRHSENVRLGHARKRAEVEASGEQYRHGRRPVEEEVTTKVRELAAQGLSQRKIAAELDVSVGTVNKYLKAA